MRLIIRLGAASAFALLVLGGCSAPTNDSQVAAGPGDPMATTAPLAVPPVLRQPDRTQAEDPNVALATTAPLAAPAPAAAQRTPAEPIPTQSAVSFDDPDPVATATPSSTPVADEVLGATAVPARETTSPAATIAPAEPAAGTAASSGAAVPAETAAAATAAAPPAQSAGGPTISLGDFEVVNLITRQTQNIAELSPNGATMLWFWAPH